VIDFGCFLDQAVRQLVNDAVPLDRGYELFCDGELMREKKMFASGHIFDDQFLGTVESVDYLYADWFMHLFGAETQRDVCERLTRLAKRAITGRQVSPLVPEERSRLSGLPGNKMMRHSPESFTRMWDEVTDGEWQVEYATLETKDGIDASGHTITFVVRKKEDINQLLVISRYQTLIKSLKTMLHTEEKCEEIMTNMINWYSCC